MTTNEMKPNCKITEIVKFKLAIAAYLNKAFSTVSVNR